MSCVANQVALALQPVPSIALRVNPPSGSPA
jgi:hypothetical protein